ncbi:MAG: hypothetical protein NT096_00285 [Proteobacteria bacterium]|nr:hypothetical protein [Pseudomonadota bacterium]
MKVTSDIGDCPCDACGKRVDERSMAVIETPDQEAYFVCQSCRGYYDDAELIEKIKAQQA